MRPVVNSWDWRGMPDDVSDFFGFVYLIESPEGMKYIGKKFFTASRRRKPLKGTKRHRRDRVESKWERYFGSSAQVLADLARLGKEGWKRTVLHLAKSRWECSYAELKFQMAHDALFRPDYRNGIIHVRLGAPPASFDWRTFNVPLVVRDAPVREGAARVRRRPQ